MTTKKPFAIAGFDRWIRPNDALDMFGDGFQRDRAIKTLLSRVAGGMITAAVGTMVRERDGARATLVMLDAQLIESAELKCDYDFWRTGDVEIVDHASYGVPIVVHRLFDVRFDPAGFGFLPSAPAPLALSNGYDDDPKQKTILSEALLSEWASLFKKAYPNGNQALARQSIDGMFPDKTVTRDRLRRIIPPAPVGKPAETSHNSNSPKNNRE